MTPSEKALAREPNKLQEMASNKVRFQAHFALNGRDKSRLISKKEYVGNGNSL